MPKDLELLVIALDGAVPSVVSSLIDKGRLPAFKALREGGVWMTDCRPPFPTITPTCWSSFATGATPATHGATCQDFRLPGMPAGKVISAYHSQNIKAERFWEAAARAGKRSLIMQLPASGPAKSPHVYQVAGAACAAIKASSPEKPTVPSDPVIPSIFADTGAEPETVSWIAATPGSGQWQPSEFASTDRTLQTGAHSGRARLQSLPNGFHPVDWDVLVEKDRIEIVLDSQRIGTVAGRWTEPFARTLERTNGTKVRVWFRARLFDADPVTKRLRLYISETGPASEFASPVEFAKRLDEIPLVPANHGHSNLLASPETMEAYLEAELHNFEWQLKAMDAGLHMAAPHIAIIYSVYLDSMNHAFRNVVEGLQPVAAAEREAVINLYHRAYELADWFLAKAIERTGTSTTVMVVSDHGSVGYTSLFDPHSVLEEAGLLVTERTTDGRRRVDYARSQVYPVSTCHVYVNLKGREPGGIVAPDQYSAVVEKTISALLCAKMDSVSPVAFAVRHDEAGFIGLGGDRTGDVIYGIRGGRVGGHIGGVHACQIPTALSETGDIRSLCVVSGPGFDQNRVHTGPMWLWDLAPTLARALGYPEPAQSEGRVVHQIMVS